MDNWTDWLLSIIVPAAKKIATALGFGYLTFTGVASTIEAAYDSTATAFSGLLPEVAALLARAGFFDAMSISAGGVLSGLAWMVMKRWALVGTGAPAA